MGEFAVVYSLPVDIEKKEEFIKGILRRAPDTPNVAALTAEGWISQVLNLRRSFSPQSMDTHDLLARADYWAKEALAAHDSHDLGYPESVMAQVRALQKEPESTLDFLRQAIQKSVSSEEIKEITSNDRKWQIFTGMTRGESQLKKLDELLKLLRLERPSLREVRNHCLCRDKHQRARFTAVKKNNGDYLMVVVEGLQEHPNDTAITWRIMGDMDLQRPVTSIDEVVKVIDEVVIPTKLIPPEV